jgi:hypothetical protein
MKIFHRYIFQKMLVEKRPVKQGSRKLPWPPISLFYCASRDSGDDAPLEYEHHDH